MALTIVCAIFAVYCLFPFVYLMINATRPSPTSLRRSASVSAKTFALFDNIATVFTYQDGIFGRWFVNTILYVVVAPAVPPCWPSWAAMRWPSSASPAVSCAS